MASSAAVCAALGGTAFAAGSPFDLLERSIDDPAFRVRVQAAQRLGQLRAWQRAIPMLRRALIDENELVRAMAAHSLGNFVTYDSARQALALAEVDSSPIVKEQVRLALSKYRPPVAVPSSRVPVSVTVLKPDAKVPAGHEGPLGEALRDGLRRTPRVALTGPASNGLQVEATIASLKRTPVGEWECEVKYTVFRAPSREVLLSARSTGRASESDGRSQRDAVTNAALAIDWNLVVRTQP